MPSVAFANNDVAVLAWSYKGRLDGCLGFAIERVDEDSGEVTPLPAWVGFPGDENPDWKPRTTREWPVQKFNWRDLTARRGGSYHYRVIPMGGAPGALRPLAGREPLVTNPVHLTPDLGIFSAYFNRGILASQSLARKLPRDPDGSPAVRELQRRIRQPGDPLRMALAGDLLIALRSLLDRAAAEGGACYCALFELNDPELCRKLLGSPRVHVILSEAGLHDQANAAIRQSLHEARVDVTDRMLGPDHLGHNKFIVYVDRAGQPRAVLTGSTNFTAHGLCAQTNNALIIESPRLARVYLDCWRRLKRDVGQSRGDPDRLQAPGLREDNRRARRLTLEDGSHADVWFAPNGRERLKTPVTPPDLGEVFALIHGARHGVLFLAFQPGTPSVLDAVASAQAARPGLFVRGALTRAPEGRRYAVDLFHLSGAHPDVRVIEAAAVRDEYASWQAELLTAGHAVIHDKIVVIDPFSDAPTVITGSHNLGYKASYANDENLLIVRGHGPLAAAYTTHVMDIYDHFRWRHKLAVAGDRAWSALDPTDGWQDKYFRPDSPWRKELAFWMACKPPRSVAR
jgi:phosphatidylserine/phosphatidylglycerophosphate/cardiolipin synthase-like enzyme